MCVLIRLQITPEQIFNPRTPRTEELLKLLLAVWETYAITRRDSHDVQKKTRTI